MILVFRKVHFLPWRLKFGHLGASGYQIYFSVYRVECIAEVRSWMLANKLRLNDSKTKLFLFASPWHAEAVSHLDIHLKIGGSVITPSSIKNLGITFDSSLSMKSHVSALCRSINFHLRNLCRIRRFIDSTTCV